MNEANVQLPYFRSSAQSKLAAIAPIAISVIVETRPGRYICAASIAASNVRSPHRAAGRGIPARSQVQKAAPYIHVLVNKLVTPLVQSLPKMPRNGIHSNL